MIKVIAYSQKVAAFIAGYDGTSFDIWNSTEGEIIKVRAEIREYYLAEQKYKCAYCQAKHLQKHGLTWDIDHVIPKACYPKYLFEPRNLTIGCKECNIAKDNYDTLAIKRGISKSYPDSGHYFKIIHPHFDHYEDYMEIREFDNRRLYVPRAGSEKARNTFIMCKLDRYSYQYAQSADFRSDVIQSISDFLDNCPPDATPAMIKAQLGHWKF